MIRTSRLFCLAAVAALLLAAGGCAARGLPEARVGVGQSVYVVEMPRSDQERYTGLSGRDDLPDGRGMLFSYDPPRVAYMHMRGMKISLDFVWIRSDRVVGVTRREPPNNDPRYQLHSPGPVDFVLELNAGEADRAGIAPGQTFVVTPLGDEALFPGSRRRP